MDELFGRDEEGYWHRFVRTGDPNEASDAVFGVWEQGEREVSLGEDDTKLFSRHEAELHLAELVEKFCHPSTLNIDVLANEISNLRGALAGDVEEEQPRGTFYAVISDYVPESRTPDPQSQLLSGRFTAFDSAEEAAEWAEGHYNDQRRKVQRKGRYVKRGGGFKIYKVELVMTEIYREPLKEE
jgi:hypothetical protein